MHCRSGSGNKEIYQANYDKFAAEASTGYLLSEESNEYKNQLYYFLKPNQKYNRSMEFSVKIYSAKYLA